MPPSAPRGASASATGVTRATIIDQAEGLTGRQSVKKLNR